MVHCVHVQVYETLTKLESGELQLRVRALELERAMVRNSVMQRASLFAIAACCAVNVATVLVATASASASLMAILTRRAAFGAALYFGSRALLTMRTLEQLLKGEREGNLNEYLLESKRSAM